MKMSTTCLGIIGEVAALLTGALATADEIKIIQNGSEIDLVGEVLLEAQDEGVLFQTQDGKIWPLQPAEILSKQIRDQATEPLTAKEMGEQIQAELGENFKVQEVGNFVLVYNTRKDYARWVAGLYRRLENGFKKYWKRRQINLVSEPSFQLPVIIFKSQAEYLQFMQRDLGVKDPSRLAYYNFESNRVVMFDLTADPLAAGEQADHRRILEVLSSPRAIPMVATVIHEGTHQLMFNYGMQTRFADTPLWVNEGLAMYFETPDLNNIRGWRSIGKVNFLRLGPFLQYLSVRPADSLRKMIEDDTQFQGANAQNNYCQSWAFCYFLLDRHGKKFAKYLNHLSTKKMMEFSSAEQRVKDLEENLEMSLQELDRQFLRYVQNLGR